MSAERPFLGPAEGWASLVAGLSEQLRALRQELVLLRQEQALLRQALAAATPARSATGERLNQEVLRRLEAGHNSDSDTALDLLIDRLHDLALDDAGSAPGPT